MFPFHSVLMSLDAVRIAVSNGRKSAYGANMIAFSERIVRLWFQVF